MIIFAGIDGTGPYSDSTYKEMFSFSHVNRLSQLPQWDRTLGPPFYSRGPSVDGLETRGYARSAYADVKRRLDRSSAQGIAASVYLAGYSRGGAAMIDVAQWLHNDGVTVECLILYDPVDRATDTGAWFGETPVIAKHCLQLRRHPSAKSRESFGNCGGNMTQVNHVTFKFIMNTTHGGVGGAYWLPSTVREGTGFIDESVLGLTDYLEFDGLTAVTPDQDKAGAHKGWVETNDFLDSMPLFRNDEPTREEHLVPDRTEVVVLANHTVQRGDSLSLLARRYYGQVHQWDPIFQANIAKIGPNPNLIEVGMELVIPKI